MKRSLAIVLVALLTLSTSPSISSAAVKAGATCKKAGQVSKAAGKEYTCIKKGKKLVWSKGVAIKAAAPAATPTPVKPSNLNTSSSITPTTKLTSLDTCKTKDLTTRSSGNNGFPRPQGVLKGAVNPKILFIPLNFPDTPSFSDTDLSRIQGVLKEVQDFYKNTSYGLVNINYEILEKSKWLTMDKTADSYGLTNPRPQQNNSEAHH